MFQSVLIILRFYRELARDLARTHGVTYPADLERVMVERLALIVPPDNPLPPTRQNRP
jgi:hypothetical protein